VGQLDVLGDGAVLVFAFHRPYVHGYIIAGYYVSYQYLTIRNALLQDFESVNNSKTSSY